MRSNILLNSEQKLLAEFAFQNSDSKKVEFLAYHKLESTMVGTFLVFLMLMRLNSYNQFIVVELGFDVLVVYIHEDPLVRTLEHQLAIPVPELQSLQPRRVDGV